LIVVGSGRGYNLIIMDHECTKAKEIDRLTRAVDGNCKTGLVENVTKMEVRLGNIETTLGRLSTNVSALVTFQTELKTIDTINAKNKLSARQKVGIALTAIIGFSGIAISIITLLI